MDGITVLLRAVHVVCGVYWAGTLFFVATLLQPSVAETLPEGGGKVMGALMRRRFFEIIPAMALLTILSGLELYRRASGGFKLGWITTPTGLSLTVGAVAALVAFTIGMSTLRPAAKAVGPLMQRAQEMTEGSERDAQLALVQRLRRRTKVGGRWVAALLLVAVIGMAIARYV